MNIILKVIEQLQNDQFFYISKNIDIAKGKYKKAKTFKEFKNYIKRNKLK